MLNEIPVTWPLQEPVIVEVRVQAMSLEDVNISNLKDRLEGRIGAWTGLDCTYYAGCD